VKPLPVTVAVSVPSMITPWSVVHPAAATESEAVVAHDRRPEGQLTLNEPCTVNDPPPEQAFVTGPKLRPNES
jgi:hypothetical protein